MSKKKPDVTEIWNPLSEVLDDAALQQDLQAAIMEADSLAKKFKLLADKLMAIQIQAEKIYGDDGLLAKLQRKLGFKRKRNNK